MALLQLPSFFNGKTCCMKVRGWHCKVKKRKICDKVLEI